jgi:hypothetical protein
MALNPDMARHVKPTTRPALWRWFKAYTGISVAHSHVCPNHSPPFDFLAQWCLGRPSVSLVCGPRGGGKSFISALGTHFDSRFHPGYGTRILGGSKAQSQQIYEALKSVILDGKGPLGSDADQVADLLKTEARYRNGSDVSILAASSRSVRGPHIPGLRLDEVDEIDTDLREASMGMNMARNGVPAMCTMTSTWHRTGGPMDQLLTRGRDGEFPVHTFCMFEVLETCPESRSGKALEKCPECPLVQWCHDTPDGIPRAKKSSGHYEIDALIQKIRTTSLRIFEADYLCLGPKADGLWFKGYDPSRHVTVDAEYDPSLPVWLAVDTGVHTGAVFFQVREVEGAQEAHVFADYLQEGLSAAENAKALRAVAEKRCEGRLDKRVTDPAGNARNPSGPTVMKLYEAEGLKLREWPLAKVADGLELIESLLCPADGKTRLRIHPRCRQLTNAFSNYRRAKRQDQWTDKPEDPQHPFEDVMDALRGGLKASVERRKFSITY